MANWTHTGIIATLESPWMTLFGERWLDNRGIELEYWRVERAHSVIVVPVQANRVLLPPPQFRPGVNRLTLDLPGGRLPEGSVPAQIAPAILRKELGIPAKAITALDSVNERGWVVDSSFSNQLLYGMLAIIDPDVPIASTLLHERAPFDASGLVALIKRLDCLQCRSVLQALLIQRFA